MTRILFKNQHETAEALPSLGLAPLEAAVVVCVLLGLPCLFFGVVVITLGGGRPGIETMAGGTLFTVQALTAAAGTKAGCVSSVKEE